MANRFVWYELMTPDTAAAKKFYGDVVGWGVQAAEGPMEYTLFTAGETPVCGLFPLPDELRANGVPPHWMGYVGVADVDAEVRRVESLGGKLLAEVHDIPDVGRFAPVADPQGAAIALYHPKRGDAPSPEAMYEPGRVGWHELYTPDVGAALDFYGEMFGWEKSQEMDMGADGVYTIFNIGEQQIGGIMTKPAQMPMPAWGYYFNVGDIDEAAARVRKGGGQIFIEPTEVPGGGWIVQGMDPQGAMFALYGKKG